jgi:arylsulfatase
MHVWTFIPPKYQALMNPKSNYGLEEAGMAQLDDSVGALLKHLQDIGEADNTIVERSRYAESLSGERVQ